MGWQLSNLFFDAEPRNVYWGAKKANAITHEQNTGEAIRYWQLNGVFSIESTLIYIVNQPHN